MHEAWHTPRFVLEKDSTASAKHLQFAGSITERADMHAWARTRHLPAPSLPPHLSTMSFRSASLISADRDSTPEPFDGFPLPSPTALVTRWPDAPPFCDPPLVTTTFLSRRSASRCFSALRAFMISWRLLRVCRASLRAANQSRRARDRPRDPRVVLRAAWASPRAIS